MWNVTMLKKEKEGSTVEGELLKRSELPIYTEAVSSKTTEDRDDIRNEYLLNAVKLFRSEGCKLARSMQSVSNRCSSVYNTGIAHASSTYVNTVDYLREERNVLQRIGAVGGGVLCGYVLGLRKGFLKRLLYTTTGGIAAGAICYPEEAGDYFKQSSQLSKKYLLISYHFLNGVSKDLVGFELPSLPSKILSQDQSDKVKKD